MLTLEDPVGWLLKDTEASESLSGLYIRCSQNLNPMHVWTDPFVIWIRMMGSEENTKGVKSKLKDNCKVVTGCNLLKWLYMDLPLVC